MGCACIARRLRQSAVCLQRHCPHHEGRLPEVMRSAHGVESSSCGTQRTEAAIRQVGCIARSRSENNFIVSLGPYHSRNPPGTRETEGTTMTKLHILVVPALVLVMLAPDAM